MVLHETCKQHYKRLLKEGWKVLKKKYPIVILQSPEGEIKEINLKYDIITLRPNGDANVGLSKYGASYNYDCVDEETSDGDATYVYKIGTGYDLYYIPDLPDIFYNITQIKLYVRARGTSASNVNAYYRLSTYGQIYTVYLGTLSYVYTLYSYTWTNNPYTGQPWTKSEINNLQIGVGINASNGEGRVTQCYLEVTYNPKSTKNKNINFSISYPFLTKTKNINFSLIFQKLRNLTFSTTRLDIQYDYNTSIKSFNLSIAGTCRTTQQIEFNIIPNTIYKPPRILINGEVVNDFIKTVRFNDTKNGFSNRITITTRNLNELLPIIKIGINTIIVKYSEKSILFDGYFDYYGNKTRKPVGDVYEFEGYNWINLFKNIYITERFEEIQADKILKQLIEKYVPNLYTGTIKPCDIPLSLIYINKTLYQAISDICTLTQCQFWISQDNVYFDNMSKRPALTEEINELNYLVRASDLKYDTEKIYNKVKIKGGLTLSSVQKVTKIGNGTTKNFKIYPGKLYDISVFINNNPLIIGQKGKDDDNQAVEVLYDTETFEFTFKVAPANGATIDFYFKYAYVPTYTMQNAESKKVWGIREAPTIENSIITDMSSAKQLAQAFLDSYSQPKLTGTVEIDMKKYPLPVHAGDILQVNLYRYFIGKLDIEEVEYNITPTQYRAIIKYQGRKSLFEMLKDLFDIMRSMRDQLYALKNEKTSFMELEEKFEKTLSISKDLTVDDYIAPYTFEGSNLIFDKCYFRSEQ